MRNLNSVITKLEAFLEGRCTSVVDAKKVEGELADLFERRDDSLIEDFIIDLASYRPEGGDGLYDYPRFKPIAEAALRRLKLLQGEDS